MQSAARTQDPPVAGPSHTCGLRCMVGHAHVAADHNYVPSRTDRRELCEAFS